MIEWIAIVNKLIRILYTDWINNFTVTIKRYMMIFFRITDIKGKVLHKEIDLPQISHISYLSHF